MVCIAGVLANKQVALGPLAVEAGIFAFLLLVIASSAVAELFGRETANRLVLIGFAPLIFSILLAIFVLRLPAAHDMQSDRLDAFNMIMGGTPRIWIAGIIAYGVSQFLNVHDLQRPSRQGRGPGGLAPRRHRRRSSRRSSTPCSSSPSPSTGSSRSPIC
jgi:uncharacterized integral membrane protein (TIGR00697 family)